MDSNINALNCGNYQSEGKENLPAPFTNSQMNYPNYEEVVNSSSLYSTNQMQTQQNVNSGCQQGMVEKPGTNQGGYLSQSQNMSGCYQGIAGNNQFAQQIPTQQQNMQEKFMQSQTLQQIPNQQKQMQQNQKQQQPMQMSMQQQPQQMQGQFMQQPQQMQGQFMQQPQQMQGQFMQQQQPMQGQFMQQQQPMQMSMQQQPMQMSQPYQYVQNSSVYNTQPNYANGILPPQTGGLANPVPIIPMPVYTAFPAGYSRYDQISARNQRDANLALGIGLYGMGRRSRHHGLG